MIVPRIVLLGDPAAATPWVGIAKKLARECCRLKIASKTYRLAAGVTIRVENIIPVLRAQQGVIKVWIEAGGAAGTFLVYPHDVSHFLGFYEALPYAYRLPISYSDYLVISATNNYRNIAKLDVTKAGIKIVQDNAYYLYGNQTYFKREYDKKTRQYIIRDRSVYSWLGSNMGDLPLSYFYGVSGYGHMVKPSGDNEPLTSITNAGLFNNPFKAVYKNGALLKHFSDENKKGAYISGFAVKDIAYSGIGGTTHGTIFLVAFTFINNNAPAKTFDTHIYIYDSLWTQIKFLVLYDYSSKNYTSSNYFYPVRFNHDSTECVVLYNSNIYVDGVFSRRIEAVTCKFLYEVSEQGGLTIGHSIDVIDTVDIKEPPTDYIPTTSNTVVEGTIQTGRTTTTTYSYGGDFSKSYPAYPIAANYNKKNELVFARFEEAVGEQYDFSFTSVTYEKSTGEGEASNSVTTVTKSGSEAITKTRTGELTFFGNTVALTRTLSYGQTIDYNSNETVVVVPAQNSLSYTFSTNRSCTNPETANAEHAKSAQMMYVDLATEIALVSESSATKTVQSLPVLEYSYNEYAYYAQYPSFTEGHSTETTSIGALDYTMTVETTHKLYQGTKPPVTVARFDFSETHVSNMSGTKTTGSAGSDDSATATREVSVAYDMKSGHYPSSYANSFTQQVVSDYAKRSFYDVGCSLDKKNEDGGAPPMLSFRQGVYPPKPLASESATYHHFTGALDSFAPGTYATYFIGSFSSTGPVLGKDFQRFSFCADPRVVFIARHPWLWSFYAKGVFTATSSGWDNFAPTPFVFAGSLTNGGAVNQRAPPGRLNEFASPSLFLYPISLC